MKEGKIKFEKGMAMVCGRCVGRLAKCGIDAKEHENLQYFIKKALKKEDIWGKVRVVESTCLGSCPASETSLYIQKRSQPQKEIYLELDPKRDTPESVLQALKEFLEV